MGMMIDGNWQPDETLSALQNAKGEFIRAESVFRDQIRADGSTPFAPASGRYHLFLSYS